LQQSITSITLQKLPRVYNTDVDDTDVDDTDVVESRTGPAEEKHFALVRSIIDGFEDSEHGIYTSCHKSLHFEPGNMGWYDIPL
jgi:hypothetical protein